jgi:hypothetical protein
MFSLSSGIGSEGWGLGLAPRYLCVKILIKIMARDSWTGDFAVYTRKSRTSFIFTSSVYRSFGTAIKDCKINLGNVDRVEIFLSVAIRRTKKYYPNIA